MTKERCLRAEQGKSNGEWICKRVRNRCHDMGATAEQVAQAKIDAIDDEASLTISQIKLDQVKQAQQDLSAGSSIAPTTDNTGIAGGTPAAAPAAMPAGAGGASAKKASAKPAAAQSSSGTMVVVALLSVAALAALFMFTGKKGQAAPAVAAK
jgi:cobalamin biosynthesis Mg chelatase CobN